MRFFDYYAKRMAVAVEQAAARPEAGPRGRLGEHVRQDAAPLVRPRDRRRRHARRLPEQRRRPRPDRGALRRRLRSGQPEAARQPRQLQPASGVPRGQRPDQRRLRRAAAADGRPRDRRRSRSTPRTPSAPPSPSAAPTTPCTSGSSSRHRDYAQAEYGARLMARRDPRHLARRRAGHARATRTSSCRSTTRAGVAMEDRWFPGPLSHPYPGVSNCRADKAFEGDPQFPIVGPARLRERRGRAAEPRQPVRPAAAARPADGPDRSRASRTDDFQSRGIPLPENYSAPSYTGLAEDVERPPPGVPARRHPVHGLLVRAVEGPVATTSRPAPTRCRATSTSATTGPRGAPTTATRPGPGPVPTRGTRPTNLPPIPSQNFLRMKAQVNNDADGWNDLVEPAVGRVGADRHDPDQGQLHARRAAVRARLPADGADLDGERLQRLHRDLPRVPARRPLPQGAHRLGPALERLPRLPPGRRWAAT